MLPKKPVLKRRCLFSFSAVIWMLVGGFSAAQSKPNLVLITVDTLRADHVSSLDEKSPVATPNIDGLALKEFRLPMPESVAVTHGSGYYLRDLVCLKREVSDEEIIGHLGRGGLGRRCVCGQRLLGGSALLPVVCQAVSEDSG